MDQRRNIQAMVRIVYHTSAVSFNSINMSTVCQALFTNEQNRQNLNLDLLEFTV